MHFLRKPLLAVIMVVLMFSLTFQNAFAAMSLDSGFSIGTGFNASINGIMQQSDGKILVGGNFTTYSGTAAVRIIRLNSDGTRDTGFNMGAGADGYVQSFAEQSDGKILAGGNFLNYSGTAANRIVRLNSDGTRDTGFNIGAGLNNIPIRIIVQSDGKILMGGFFTAYSGVTANRIVRLNSDGTIDTGFNMGVGFDNSVQSIVQQSDGKFVVGGLFTTYSGVAANRIVRLNSDGTMDTGFNIGAAFNSTVLRMVLQSDNKIIVGGFFTTYSGVAAGNVARINSDGTIDTGFNVTSGVNSNIMGMVQQSDGKIVLGGYFTTFSGVTVNSLVRLNSDGNMDTGFDIGSGFNAEIRAMTLQSDGKLLAAGGFTTYNGTSANYLARFSAPIPSDTTPDAFDLGGPIASADVDTDYYSSGIVVSGIDASVSISITGGEYSINSGSYTNATGTIDDGDFVVVKLRSSNGYSETTGSILDIGGVTDTFDITTLAYTAPAPTPSAEGFAGGGGVGGGSSSSSSVSRDSCPDGDYSSSPYDRLCGTKPLALPEEEPTEQPQVPTASAESCPEGELQGAYEFAHSNQITTTSNCHKANMYGSLMRGDVAKMISNFAINVMKKVPDTTKKCEFEDMIDADTDSQHYAKLACQLGLMGINNTTSEALPLFGKDKTLTRGEFAAILSRLLFGSLYNVDDGAEWYAKHMQALIDNKILTKNDPFMIEVRGYVMLMLQRVADMK